MNYQNTSTHSRKPFIIGYGVFFLLIFLTQYLAFQKYLLDKKAKSDELLQELNLVKDRINSSLANGLSATKTLAFIVENYGVPQNFDTLAKDILKSNKNIDALELTSKGVITNIYPLIGNEAAIGYNVLADSLTNSQALRALEKRELFFAGPLKYKQGGIGFVGRLPIFREGEFVGFSVVLISLPTFLKGAGIDTLAKGNFIYQISKTNSKTQVEEFFLPSSKFFNKKHSKSIALKGGEWTLYASARENNYIIGAAAISVFGIALSVVFALLAVSKVKQPEILKRLVSEKTRQLAESEKHFRAMIEKSADAIVLFDRDGKTLYQTPSSEKITGYSFQDMQTISRIELVHPNDREGDAFVFDYLLNSPGTALRRNHRMKHKCGDYIWIEGTYTNLLQDENIKAIVYNYYDITQRIESEKKAAIANRLYEVSSRINRVMVSGVDEKTLFAEVCRIAVNCGKFQMAWIGMINDSDSKVTPIVHAGEENGYLTEIKSIVLNDTNLSQGPIGTAVLSGTYVYCNDIEKDSKMKPWAKEALERGYKSAISLPIKKTGRVIGTFTLYASTINYFNEKEIALLEEAAADISFSLETFENERLRKKAEQEVLNVYKDKETTLNRIKDSVVALDKQWRYTFLNEAALAEHSEGYSKTLGRVIWEVHPEIVGSVFWHKYHEAMEQRKVVEFENYYPPLGVWYFVKVYPSEDGLTIFYSNITDRKKAEEQINAEQILSESIIKSLPGIFYFYDEQGKFLRWNKNFELISGYSSSEISSMHPLDFYSTDEKKFIEEKIAAVFKTGSSDAEAHFLTKNNQKIPYYFNGHQVQFNGKTYLIGMGIDITILKEIENDLKENEKKYRLLFNKSPVATWMLLLPSYDIIDVNDAAIKKYGYTRQEFLSMNARDILSEKDLETFKKGSADRTYDAASFSGKWHHLKKNGSALIAEVIAHDLTFGNKNVRIVLANDVTEREQAETELRSSESRLRDAQTVAKLGSWETNLATLKVIWSEETFRVFEVDPTNFQITHSKFLEYVHPDDRETVDKAFVQSQNKTTLNSIEHRIVTKSGVKMIEERWRIIYDETEQAILAVGTCQDITPRKKAEELLQQSQQELRKLYTNLQNVREEERTGIAREIHDELGQQLTGLKMDSFWIMKKLGSEEQLAKEKIKDMIALIDGTIKTVRRISSELRPSILDDLGLVAAIDWQGQEFEKRTGIQIRFRSHLVTFDPDKNLSTHLFRVYQEALTNVARHSSATKVDTVLEEKEGHLHLTVKDNGQGFDKKEAEAKNSLGLLGMRERALMFNGELNVESEKLHGTRISLKIPLLHLNKARV
jgi:PAS domain S-box-containing protein